MQYIPQSQSCTYYVHVDAQSCLHQPWIPTDKFVSLIVPGDIIITTIHCILGVGSVCAVQ